MGRFDPARPNLGCWLGNSKKMRWKFPKTRDGYARKASPLLKSERDRVVGGTGNKAGRLHVKVAKIGSDAA